MILGYWDIVNRTCFLDSLESHSELAPKVGASFQTQRFAQLAVQPAAHLAVQPAAQLAVQDTAMRRVRCLKKKWSGAKDCKSCSSRKN